MIGVSSMYVLRCDCVVVDRRVLSDGVPLVLYYDIHLIKFYV